MIIKEISRIYTRKTVSVLDRKKFGRWGGRRLVVSLMPGDCIKVRAQYEQRDYVIPLWRVYEYGRMLARVKNDLVRARASRARGKEARKLREAEKQAVIHRRNERYRLMREAKEAKRLATEAVAGVSAPVT